MVLSVVSLLLLFYHISALEDIRSSIKATQNDADRIIQLAINGSAKHQVYNRLAQFTDTIGPRVCGSKDLDKAIDYVLQALKEDGLENVHGEAAKIPKWVRGTESCYMLQPRFHRMSILGLGHSVGTQNTTGEAIVVTSFDDLKNKSNQGMTQGKIIVYNSICDWKKYPVDCYGMNVQYRVDGANQAARAGGIAALVRSVAAASLYTPHTGEMFYDDDVQQIPTASITIEDADMLQRMQQRGQKIILSIHMDASYDSPVISQNVIAEITGSEKPEEVIIISGHLDSWDVGEGAMDDGGGAFISWQALSYMNQLNIRPKRTIRAIMWTCEEFGGIGAQQYYDNHKANTSLMDLVMESDMGVFHPLGIQFTGTNEAMQIMQEVAQLLVSINTTQVTTGGDGTDISPWMQAGVPGASLYNQNEKYFDYHHSNADTIDVLNADDMDLCAATWAVTALGVANLPNMLPR